MVTTSQPTIKHCYEGMLIYDARAAKKDLDALETSVTELFTKHGVEIAASHRWGERRFAYEIKRQKKGFYILYHVNADPAGLAGLRRDLGLQEALLRFLFLRIPSIPETFEFPSDPEERDDRRGRRDDRPRDGERRPRDGGDKPAEESKAAESKTDGDAPAAAAPAADAPAAEAPAGDAPAAEAPAAEGGDEAPKSEGE